MAKAIASITTSVDGYIAGPDDGPGKGLGDGGERLPYGPDESAGGRSHPPSSCAASCSGLACTG
jgi:hypothetical protein